MLLPTLASSKCKSEIKINIENIVNLSTKTLFYRKEVGNYKTNLCTLDSVYFGLNIKFITQLVKVYEYYSIPCHPSYNKTFFNLLFKNVSMFCK